MFVRKGAGCKNPKTTSIESLTHKMQPWLISGKWPAGPMKTCARQSKFEYYKVCAEWYRKEEERGGGSSLATTHVSKYKRHSFTRKWGWEPILLEGSKTEWWVTECHANSLKQQNGALRKTRTSKYQRTERYIYCIDL